MTKLVMAVRLKSEDLKDMAKLAVAACLCELALAVILNLSSLEHKAARPRSDGFEQAAAGLRGFCELASKLNLDDLEWAAAGLCELGTQAAARLSMGSVVQTGTVLEADVAIRVAHHHWKTTCRRLSCMYVAEGSE